MSLRTLPKRHCKKATNTYYDPNPPPLPSIKPKYRAKNVFLARPYKTIHQLQNEQGLKFEFADEYEFYPLLIKSFQFENNKKYIFCDMVLGWYCQKSTSFQR